MQRRRERPWGLGRRQGSQVGVGGAACRPGTPGGSRAASLLGAQFLPDGYLLTGPPGFDERMESRARLFHSKNQNREKQMLGNGVEGAGLDSSLSPVLG